ncbi:MAG: UDP-3-O-(3-hydroxymyristoyl)glucosamine N-acyltransferase [Deltaproteobacteria bacterium]|nr:UDP-3-O-(3-hydroxymyristoyl)glucosamine N-acyltransferase [Deltaproteobacteria bacterium]MBW2155366.1 UDP-3-O-(3-hydroxymyristoyl)glucosamine N-acyltransferase [Deltaproteobacteria bacterium]MBW2326589.1 UDP-3-O-(3-hydroxymyristoyl)glucosamine N-acyltransferase [Deltaproteobacteria bacterium]
MKQYTTEQINQVVNGTLKGSPTIMITGVEQISEATTNQLTFIGEKKYIKLWDQSRASAAIVNNSLDIEPGENRAFVRVGDADLALASVLQLFELEAPKCEPGIHSTAVVDSTAEIGTDAAIGAGCYIGPGVVIGANTKLYPNVTVLDDSSIGSETIIWSGTVIRERCCIGNCCIIHPNVTIGADGFGYRPSSDGRGLVKIPQIGTVEIGDGVEIGAGSCVDRGKFSATSIGDGTKIDNLVQIAHNCKLGRSCVMAGQSGLAGSVTLGDGVIMGGRAAVKDHVTVGAGAKLGGGAGVISDVAPGKTLLGIPADDYRQTLRLWAAQKQLPDLIKQMKKK